MTRTKKTRVKARGGRVAVIGALGLASVALAAGPAFAKGVVDVTAPHTAHVGKSITVKAYGDDDSAGYLHQLCLEERSGEPQWHQESCSAAVEADARVVIHGTAAHRGNLEFRAVLYGLTSRHDRHPVRLQASDVVTVHVRGASSAARGQSARPLPAGRAVQLELPHHNDHLPFARSVGRMSY